MTNKPPGDTGRNPEKSQTKTEKRDAKKDADDLLATILEWLTRVWRSSAKVTRNSPPLQVSQRSSRSNEVRELQTFLVELHSRGNYSRGLRVEPTLWSKHQMCASQKFACIVLATLSSCSWFHIRRSLLALHIARNPADAFSLERIASQKSSVSQKSHELVFDDFFAQEFWLGCIRNHRFLDAESWSRSVSLEAAVYLEPSAFLVTAGVLAWNVQYVVLLIALIGEKSFLAWKRAFAATNTFFCSFDEHSQ